MTTNFDDVGAFHEKFGLPVSGGPVDLKAEPDQAMLYFRGKFMQEELNEFIDACEATDGPDHAGMFDALIDLVYVAMGTAHMLGYPWQAGWNAVQSANMKKVRANADASNSKRGSALDVVKPAGWQPPDILAVLLRASFACEQCEGHLAQGDYQIMVDGHPHHFCRPSCAADWQAENL